MKFRIIFTVPFCVLREAAVKCLDLLDTLPPEDSAAQHRHAQINIFS